jgi:hypothetical protein
MNTATWHNGKKKKMGTKGTLLHTSVMETVAVVGLHLIIIAISILWQRGESGRKP